MKLGAVFAFSGCVPCLMMFVSQQVGPCRQLPPALRIAVQADPDAVHNVETLEADSSRNAAPSSQEISGNRSVWGA